MRDPDDRHEDPAHDVLAAEEFGMPTGDPALRPDPPHDVLAAEEFEVPGGDPALRRRAVQLPEDPSGITEPHDVLAAEEFAVPAAAVVAGPGADAAPQRGGRAVRVAGAVVAGAFAGAAAFVAHRRRS